MSTTAEVEDLEALQQALNDVRSDSSGVGRKSWVLAGHRDNNPNLIGLVGQDVSEEANLEDFVSQLEEDQVMYGLIRMSTTFDMSSTVKFLYVHWIGEKVPFAKKGRFGVVHGSVEEHFNPYHLLVETGNMDDLHEDELIKRLEESSMTRNKVLEGNSMDGRQERGFLSGQIKRQENKTARLVAPAGIEVEVDPALQEAIGSIRNDKEALKWVAAGFEEGNLKKPLILVGQGEGDIEELKECLQDDQVHYALYRTSDVIDDITTIKFVYIYWVGENVKPLTKGKVSAYAGPIEKIFSPVHTTLSFSNRYDLTEEIIRDKVMSGSGSKSFVK